MRFDKKRNKFLCFVLNLHYVAYGEDRLRFDKKRNKFLCFVLNLHYLCSHFTLKTRLAMVYTGLHKKTIIHSLIVLIMLLLPATGLAVPQQQKTDITKPTRERVKDNSKKGNDQKSSDKNKKDNKADKSKQDSKTAAAAAAASNKKDPKKADSGKKDNKASSSSTGGKKDAAPATPKKDDKPAVAPKKDDKPATPQTLLDNKSAANKPAQDTTKKEAKPAAEQPQRPPVNTETTKFDAIDVSKHQGTIDWEELKKNSKIQLVYIKATEGSDYIDPKYKENIRNARRHGFKVGSYHFLTNRSSATSQFRNFVRNVNREEQDLLPVIDVEEVGRWSSVQLRDSLKVFADLLEDYYGCKPVIYTSEKFFIKHLGRAFSGYPLFIAKYNSTTQPEIGYKWVLWQFTDRGYFKPVKGNRGLVDLSRFNKGCSINDLIYKPSQHKPKASVMDAVDHKEKPATINATEQKPKEDPAKASAKASAKQKAEEKKKAAEKEAKEKEQKKKQAREDAKKAKEKAEADKKAKEKADADRKAKQKAEQQRREKERQEAAKKTADEKAKRKAAAKQAREEKAKQQTTSKGSGKSASVRGALTQSQRNDSIRTAKQSGRKINKSSADND